MFSIISFRLHELTGEINNLTFLGGKQIKDFTKANENSVIFFTDAPNLLHFSKFAITFYKNVSFARSSEREGKGFGCKDYPCIVPFHKGRKVKDAAQAPFDAANFTRWCKDSFDGKNHVIEHPEDLRKLLETKDTIVFGVGVSERPKWLDSKLHFYATTSKVFEILKIKVSDGLYSYSASSRIMKEIKDNEQHDFGRYVSYINQPEMFTKKYWGGFVLDPTNITDNEVEFKIMDELGKKYKDSIKLAPIHDGMGWDAIRGSNVMYFDIPFFVLFETNGDIKKRWLVIKREDSHNIEYLDGFINGIINGTQKYTVIDEQPQPTKKYMKTLTYSTFWPTIESNEGDSLVVFTSAQCESCLKPYLLINKTATLLRENTIRVYSYNCSINEVPDNYTAEPTLPTIALFKHGKVHEKPAIFKGHEFTEDIIQWIQNEATSKIVAPPFDIHKVRKDIADEYYKYAPQEEFVATKVEKHFD